MNRAAKDSLRCTILAVGDFPEGGAVSQRLYLLAKILNEDLGEASVWILHPTRKNPSIENKRVCGEWGGVRFRYLSGTTIRPKSIAGAIIDTAKGILGSIRSMSSLRMQRPDVLIVYTPRFFKFILPIIAAKLLRIPVIAEICEINSQTTELSDRGLIRRVVNGGESFMERLIPVVTSGAIVISTRIRQYYENLGMLKSRMLLVPALIDYRRYEQGGSDPVGSLEGKLYFLNSGSFNEKDGLEHIVKAVLQVRKQYPDLCLVFTGDAPPGVRQRIINYAGNTESDWILFTGFLSRESLIWCYKNAAGLLSCRSDSQYANFGFPTKLAEYLATGTPVVITRVGDVDEYLDAQSAFIAEPENATSISAAMLSLLGDRGAAREVGMCGRQIASKRFDYVNLVAPVAQFIRDRVAGRK